MAGFFMNRATDGLRAMAEAGLPENDLGEPDWRSTDVVARTLDYLAELPAKSRNLLVLLFFAIEVGAPLFVPALRRFSRLSIERRIRALNAWPESRLPWLRILGDSVKAILTMMYTSHVSVSDYMGEYRTGARPEDPVQLVVRPGALIRHYRQTQEAEMPAALRSPVAASSADSGVVAP